MKHGGRVFGADLALGETIDAALESGQRHRFANLADATFRRVVARGRQSFGAKWVHDFIGKNIMGT